MPENKFSELFAARDKNKDSASVSGADENNGDESRMETDAGSPPSNSSTIANPSKQSSSGQTGRSEQIAHKRSPGRPPGKRSNPDYEQATIYIRKDTHRAVKLALLQNEDSRQFSELVEDLLQQWVTF